MAIRPETGATALPSNFAPPSGWQPKRGQSLAGWRPPVGFSPAGGWRVPPGFNPPVGLRESLVRSGWYFDVRRGWVIPSGWVPGDGFVFPVGFVYVPASIYAGAANDPGRIVVRPGQAFMPRPVLPRDQSYAPPPPPSAIHRLPPPPPRRVFVDQGVAPLPPPVAVTSTDDVVKALSRRRVVDPLRRYEGPVLETGAVRFDYNKFDIRPESFDTLDRIGEALVAPPLDRSIIRIEGHTDSDGSDDYNQRLSEKRAWAVRSYLVERFGLDPNRLVIVGYGETAPVATNVSEDGKQRNRRVEFENVTDFYNPQVEASAPAEAQPAATEAPAPPQ